MLARLPKLKVQSANNSISILRLTSLSWQRMRAQFAFNTLILMPSIGCRIIKGMALFRKERTYTTGTSISKPTVNRGIIVSK